MENCIIKPFGRTFNGDPVEQILISDGAGNTASLLNYGAILHSLWITTSEGNKVDVCLGYNTLAEYETSNSCFGGTIGRCTGRISGASVVLSGTEYKLSENRKGYHMHGGYTGFHKKVWSYQTIPNGVCFTYFSRDGEEGYPGNLYANVTYYWADKGTLALIYDCVSDKETIINLTNHSYFNLNGHETGSAMEHQLSIFSNTVAETARDNIPTGKFLAVTDTPVDFRQTCTIGSRIDTDCELLKKCGGYDHAYILPEAFAPAAVLTGEKSGITMTVLTDLPALVFYSANFLAVHPGKNNTVYGPRHGICLETQYMPDGANLVNFSPKPIFGAEEHMTGKTLFQFSI